MVAFLPLLSLLLSKNVTTSYKVIFDLFTHARSFIVLIFVGLAMLMARISIFNVIKYFNATLSSIFYNLSQLITPLLILIIGYLFNAKNSIDFKLIQS